MKNARFISRIPAVGVVVVVCQLDLKLPMQSMPITINVVSSNPEHGRCAPYNIMWSSLSGR